MFGPLGADKYDEYCSDIRASGLYFRSKSINDILDMSRIEAGRMKLHMDEVNLDRIMQDLPCASYPGKAQDKNVELDFPHADAQSCNSRATAAR